MTRGSFLSYNYRMDKSKVAALIENMEKVVRGKPEAVRLAVVALLGRGHLLIEDVPGIGKTTLAYSLARSAGASTGCSSPRTCCPRT